MAASMTPAQLVDAFLKVYEDKFISSRTELAALYEDASSFAFEGTTLRGKAGIAGALAKLPIPAGAKRRRVTTNIQGSPSAGAYVVLTTGDLAGAAYRQLFQLVPKTGGYYVHNDIFRAGVANPDNAPADIGGATIKQIITTYYQLFDSDRSKLTVLYSAASTFSFEDDNFVGQEAIIKKLTSLPGTKHAISTIDLQTVSGDSKVLLALVTGEITIEGSTNPLKFCQAFQFIHNGTTYYVHNDIFRLNYG